LPNPTELEALKAAADLEATPGNISRLCSRYGDAGRWAFTQIALREKGLTKFAHAPEMFFTREALEQASHELVAAYHASQFPTGALVADLTTGIGGDLLALARRGPTIGYDISVERMDYALHNLGVERLKSELRHGDALQSEWDFEYAFADPARRVEGVRTLDPGSFSPDPRILSQRMAGLRKGGIKLSPMLDDGVLEGMGPRLEFISLGRECREALVWLGREVVPGREAVHLESGQRLKAGPPPPQVEEPGEYFYEADSSAIRAHALGSLGLSALGASNGYLTGSTLVTSPWVTGFRVLYHGKADLKSTARVLTELGSAIPELKQRGIKQDLAAIRRSLTHQGRRITYLAIWPVGPSLRHTILERISL
jgi:hypothetical protein